MKGGDSSLSRAGALSQTECGFLLPNWSTVTPERTCRATDTWLPPWRKTHAEQQGVWESLSHKLQRLYKLVFLTQIRASLPAAQVRPDKMELCGFP